MEPPLPWRTPRKTKRLTRKKKPDWMTPEAYDQASATLKVREFKAGGKIMITTFLDSEAAPKNELKVLYRRR
jgi:hypothetical protein